jgi:hypothetical protein
LLETAVAGDAMLVVGIRSMVTGANAIAFTIDVASRTRVWFTAARRWPVPSADAPFSAIAPPPSVSDSVT